MERVGDAITGRGGALETLVEARDAGLTRWLGITGHGVDAPAVFPRGPAAVPVRLGAVPLNFAQMGNPAYRRDAEALLARCRELDVGTIIIKSITRGPWGDDDEARTTWYRPSRRRPTSSGPCCRTR